MKTYYDMHAGGIVALDGKLHVADSRSGHRVIRVYDLNKITKLPSGKTIHKYSHVLIEEYNYKAPIKPSFISYDRDRKKILIGTFAEEPSDSKPNLLSWYTPPRNASEAAKFDKNIDKVDVYRLPNKYKKIQGMVASKAPDGKQILWLSTSYGRYNRSNFYKMNININSSTPKSPEKLEVTNSHTAKYPPGLEDAHLATNDQLWMLTEFAYSEGNYKNLSGTGGNIVRNQNRRGVFAIDKSDILP